MIHSTSPGSAEQRVPAGPDRQIANTTTITTHVMREHQHVAYQRSQRVHEERHAHRTDDALGLGKAGAAFQITTATNVHSTCDSAKNGM